MNPEILDSTLREGEQTPGVIFSIDQKLEIAKLIDDFGVDFIEAGHPSVSSDTKKGVKEIANENLDAKILAHSRAIKADIDDAIDCGVDWVGIFFCVSNACLEERFRRSEEEATKLITDTIEYAKDHGLKVRYTPEDTVRTEIENVVKVSKKAIEAGADRISIADTAGIMTPMKMYNFVKVLSDNLSVPLNVHCHNDLGMAVANSLAAVEAGARLVDVTVNGLGERTGIAPLSEVTTALKLAYKDNNSNWKMEMLPEISRLVEKYSGLLVPENSPIVGKNAFTHNAGLHVSAVLKNPIHYESIPACMVGRKRDIVIDKFSSKSALSHKVEKLGIKIAGEGMDKLLKKIKEENHNSLTDDRLKRMANEI